MSRRLLCVVSLLLAPAVCGVGAGVGELTVNARLYTADGLLLNACYRGHDNSEANQPKATVMLRTPDGKELDSHACGFA